MFPLNVLNITFLVTEDIFLVAVVCLEERLWVLAVGWRGARKGR